MFILLGIIVLALVYLEISTKIHDNRKKYGPSKYAQSQGELIHYAEY